MTQKKIPLVVQGISVERALKQIRFLLDQIEPENPSIEDRVYASIQDVETMLNNLDRG